MKPELLTFDYIMKSGKYKGKSVGYILDTNDTSYICYLVFRQGFSFSKGVGLAVLNLIRK